MNDSSVSFLIYWSVRNVNMKEKLIFQFTLSPGYKIVLLLSLDHVLIRVQFEVTFLPPINVTSWTRQSSQIQ